MDFASLLAPMGIAEFREAHWAKGAVLLPRRSTRFDDLGFDFDLLCRELLLSSDPDVKAQFFDADGVHRDFSISPAQINACFAAGMTVCFSRVDPFLPGLKARIDEWRRSLRFAGKMNFSCYWSPDGAGFGLHYDDRPVFICQLEGRKQWWYSREPAFREPRANFLYDPAELTKMKQLGLAITPPDDASLETAVLEPGDMLYLPAGTWHKTAAMGESRALTLRTFDATPASTLRQALEQLFDGDAAWRAPLPIVDRRETEADRAHPAVMGVLAERLDELKAFVARLTPVDLARAWNAGQTWARPDAGPGEAPLSPEDRLFVPDNVAVLRAENARGETCLYVHTGQREIELVASENPWFESVLAAGEFTASRAGTWGGEQSSWEETKELLADLCDRGILSRKRSARTLGPR